MKRINRKHALRPSARPITLTPPEKSTQDLDRSLTLTLSNK